MTMTTFETYLNKFTETDWLNAVESLLPEIHEVDRNAVQIWFRFYPVSLFRYIEAAEDKESALRGIAMQGNYELKTQIDTSHHFLYGHRYWKTVKAAIEAEAEVFQDSNVDLAEEIRQIAAMVADRVKADASLLISITAAGLMTLVQSGLQAVKTAPGDVKKPGGILAKSPDQIVAERAKDDSQGLLGFLKTVDKTFSIRHDENDRNAKFAVMNLQELTGASSLDRSQNWQEKDDRCWDGVIPIECTAASCGTCWVGVLGGEEKLTEVAGRERRAVKVFGYNQPDEPKPFIRLACQAKATGNATIVIPPWNAVFGRKLYGNVEELELEPVTTSAKALRETVKGASTISE